MEPRMGTTFDELEASIEKTGGRLEDIATNLTKCDQFSEAMVVDSETEKIQEDEELRTLKPISKLTLHHSYLILTYNEVYTELHGRDVLVELEEDKSKFYIFLPKNISEFITREKIHNYNSGSAARMTLIYRGHRGSEFYLQLI